MKTLRASLKSIAFIGLAGSYILIGQLIRLSDSDLNSRRKKLIYLISWYSRTTLKMMGVHVYVKCLNEGRSPWPTLIACNHMSYLDVLVLASRHPAAFVTSIEVKETPFLGLLSELGGCLYVERRSRNGLAKEVSDITNALQGGLRVIFFPEGTSTNGDEILRFKRPLFQAAIDAEVHVWPMTLNYFSVDDEEFTLSNRDKICWYGDMPFLSHLFQLFGQREVTALITQHQQIDSHNRVASQLAELSHLFVKSRYYGCRAKIPFTADINNSFSRDFTLSSIESTSSFESIGSRA